MAKITAANIQNDILETNIKLVNVSRLITKTKYEYIAKASSIKTNTNILKTLLDSIQRENKKNVDAADKNEETLSKKIQRERIEEQQAQDQKKKDTEVNALVMSAALGLKAPSMLAQQIETPILQEREADGTNGRLSPDDLVAVGTVAGFPEGGPYWYGRTAYLRPSAANAFLEAKAAAAAEGITIIINSAYRSYEHQEAIQGKYSVVAPPGTSPHGLGFALDIEQGPGWNWMVKNGMRYGWKWMAIPNDEVHFEYVGGESEAEPVKRTVPKEISSTNNKLGLVAVVPQQQPLQPQYLVEQPQVASAPRIKLNTYKTNPFFITPTG